LSQEKNLKSLEIVLESFLERATDLHMKQFNVVEGISRLDKISRGSLSGEIVADKLGDWFAENNRWLTAEDLGLDDVSRIDRILGTIQEELEKEPETSPAVIKIGSEIDRWKKTRKTAPGKLTFKRGEEVKSSEENDTITVFKHTLSRMMQLYQDSSASKVHVMSVLDDALKSADLQHNKESLLLSAVLIYYLKINGYKVEPFVKRLKEAEGYFRKGRKSESTT